MFKLKQILTVLVGVLDQNSKFLNTKLEQKQQLSNKSYIQSKTQQYVTPQINTGQSKLFLTAVKPFIIFVGCLFLRGIHFLLITWSSTNVCAQQNIVLLTLNAEGKSGSGCLKIGPNVNQEIMLMLTPGPIPDCPDLRICHHSKLYQRIASTVNIFHQYIYIFTSSQLKRKARVPSPQHKDTSYAKVKILLLVSEKLSRKCEMLTHNDR